MLNEHEKESLREIQQVLAEDDPSFADRFTAWSGKRFAKRIRPVPVAVIALLLLTVLMIILGLPGQAFLFAASIFVVLCWQRRGRIAHWWKSLRQ